ncbi:MAG TPA: hypothetical protein VE907_02030 [Gammaproteobacteria bacterium]|nr:hypothetical protein [Gammaproteobacteria bacterium]
MNGAARSTMCETAGAGVGGAIARIGSTIGPPEWSAAAQSAQATSCPALA